MSRPTTTSEPLSRRAFLRRAGGAAAALAAQSLLAAPAAAAAAQSLTVGILAPSDGAAAERSATLLAGLRLAAERSRHRVELRVAEYGASQARAVMLGRALLADPQIQVLAGFISPNDIDLLTPALEARGVPLVVSDIGANVVSAGQEHPLVIRNSLGHWQAAYALGAWAARGIGGRAVMAASLYDAGYDTLYAFEQGFTAAGGTVDDSHVTHRPAGAPLDAAIAAIADAAPDLVFAAYSGREAADFVRAYAAAGLAGRTPLLGSAFLADERLLPELGDAALGIRTAHTWAAAAPANRVLARRYAQAYGQAPDSFAVLGYDTGRLITAALDRAGGDVAALPRMLAEAHYTGGRGVVRIDPTSRASSATIVLREVRREGGSLRNIPIARLRPTTAGDALVAEMRGRLRTGWVHAYLSV